MKHWGLMELKEYLSQNNIILTTEQCDALMRHLEYVLEVNNHIQLTTIRDLEDGIRLHILDSLTCLPEINSAINGPLLDMGTGGGFPGIPLAVATGRDVVLLDSVKKKLHALEDLLLQDVYYNKLSLRPVRAEELALAEPGRYAAVTARALSSLPSIIELATPLLAFRGSLVALKGNLSDEELVRGDKAASLLGLQRSSIRRFELADSHEQRCIVVYTKIGKSKCRLPRRVGMAQRQPLA